jgi:hypothetical protein
MEDQYTLTSGAQNFIRPERRLDGILHLWFAVDGTLVCIPPVCLFSYSPTPDSWSYEKP